MAAKLIHLHDQRFKVIAHFQEIFKLQNAQLQFTISNIATHN